MDGDGVTQIVSLLYLSGLHLCLLFCLNKVVTLAVHNNLRLLQQFVNLVTDLSSQFFLGGNFGWNGRTQKQQRRIREHVLVDPRVQALWSSSREHKHYFGGLL